MAALASNLRRQLEAVIVSARAEAEVAAKAALEALAIHHHEPFYSMTPEDRDLRTRLRAHARQLGDTRDGKKGTQAIDHLIAECAYEHWHRMLFARFLAENDLLIEPESGVVVSLEDCKELAREKGDDPWALASRFAQRMLPQIFRPEDPVLQVALSREHQSRLESLLEKIPSVSFKEDDSLGWVYQFWQSKRKDEVNAAGGKIGADELAPVTQLFTEHYMVLFLLHNTVGAWHAGKVLARNPDLARTATNEEELRAACAIPGYQWGYLRFVREGEDGPWRPAAGTFEKWPRTAKEITVIDPCCGSGHFLVAVFDCLVRFRMVEEELSTENAARAVLSGNIFGLELDLRCTQLAAFGLAFAAWKFAGRVISLPPLNVACSGLAVGVGEEEWTNLAGDDIRLRKGMGQLHALFKQAPELGSLIDPKLALSGELFAASFRQLQPLFEKALTGGGGRADVTTVEVGVTAKGMIHAGELLAGAYTLVITNVPYLKRGKQSKVLTDHIEEHYSDGKGDLATAFLLRCTALLIPGGTSSIVMPQNWLFLTSYKKFRENLLRNFTWHLIAQLGSGAFETISGEVVKAILINFSQRVAKVIDITGIPIELSANVIRGLNVSGLKASAEKSEGLMMAEVKSVEQKKQLENPDARVVFRESENIPLLEIYAFSYKGITTGDDPKYRRSFWECNPLPDEFRYFQSTVESTRCFGGAESIVWYKAMTTPLQPGVYLRAADAIGKTGVMISQMSSLPVARYLGEPFDTNAGAVIPKDIKYLQAVWCFCSSSDYKEAVRQIDQSLKVTNATLVKVPFDLNHWKNIATIKYPNGLPKPYSDDPTQWIFHGNPSSSITPLQVAVVRLLGYRWPAELNTGMELSSESRRLIESAKDLLTFVDDNGIICLPPVRGGAPASELLRALLAKAFGSGWTPVKERELIAQTGSSTESLDAWLRDDFFAQHCALFHHRPFVWHIWDGRKDGFHALVNYHKLAEGEGKGRRLLESLTYSYLGDWMNRQKAAVLDGEAGADARLAAAAELQEQMKKILEGESPYDLFIRWKPLDQQPIGWNPDIKDGVRMNVRPFMMAMLSKGKTGAGVLRTKPNIKWEKDRGKETSRPKEKFPWFWDGSTFTGDRLNDCHYSNAEKLAAREKCAGMPA